MAAARPDGVHASGNDPMHTSEPKPPPNHVAIDGVSVAGAPSTSNVKSDGFSASTASTVPIQSDTLKVRTDHWYPTTTGAIHSSIRARLPPTIDQSIAPFCAKARQAFLSALVHDQRSALQPDYRSSFTDTRDVVRRLLPYHVWHVRDDDLLHVLKAAASTSAGKDDEKRKRKLLPTESDSTETEDGAQLASTSKKIRRPTRVRYAGLMGVQREQFPSPVETDKLWDRFFKIDKRSRVLQGQLTGADTDQAPARFSRESCYHLEHLARESEQELLNAKKEEFREAKEQAMAHGVTWEALMRISAGMELDNVPILRQQQQVQNNPATNGNPGFYANVPQQFPSAPFAMPMPGPGASGQFRPYPFGPVMPTFASNEMRPFQPVNISAVQQGFNSPNRTPSQPMPPVRGSRPRGRPRKQRDEQGRIIRTPPPAGHAPLPRAMPSARPLPPHPTALQQPYHTIPLVAAQTDSQTSNAAGINPGNK